MARTKRNKSAKRTDPALWEAVKAEVTAGSKGGRPGQWSARKAQMAVRLYKERGGGYVGPKDPDNSLTKWTQQDWRTKSGRPSLQTGERYLPADAIDALTDEEYAETTRAKRRGTRKGKQFVKQPAKIAKKTAKYRKNTKDRVRYVWSDFGRHPDVNERLVTLMINDERRGFLRVKRDLDMPELTDTAGCPEDLIRLYQRINRRSKDSDFPVWQGWITEIDYNYRNKGYGKDIYKEAIHHIKEEMREEGYSGFFFIPSFCGSRDRSGTTTAAAKRVWRSLARDNRHKQGLILFFSIPQNTRNRRNMRLRPWESHPEEPQPVSDSVLPKYVYHATHLGKMNSIAEDGLVPSGGSHFGGYDFHSRGRVFFSGKTGVPYWFNKMEQVAEHSSDFNSSEDASYWTPVVLRVSTRKPRNSYYKDELGERDSLRPAFFLAGFGVSPRNMDIWDGESWVNVEDADIEGMMDKAGEVAQYEYDDDEHDGWYNPDFNLFAPKGV